MKAFEDLEQAKAFHGHLGPNLVIGMKMGNYAVKTLGTQTHFDMTVSVYCAAKPPISCIIDGLQLSTGCTMGKANIVHVVSDTCVKAMFTNSHSDKSLCLQVNEGVMDKFGSLVDEIGEEEASRKTWKTADEEIFSVCE